VRDRHEQVGPRTPMGPPAVGFGESRKDVLEADQDPCRLPRVIPPWLFWPWLFWRTVRHSKHYGPAPS